MANHLTITKRLTNAGWTITGSVASPATIPRDIFVYENTGESQLGEYHSVVMVSDMPRIAVWQGSPLPVLRNKFVRYAEIKILVPRDQDVDLVIRQLVASTENFVEEFNSVKESTQTYVID